MLQSRNTARLSLARPGHLSFAACDERRSPSSYVVFAADVPGSRVPAANTTINLRIDPPIRFYSVRVPTYD